MTLLFGLDLVKTTRSIKALPLYVHDLSELKRQQKRSGGTFPFGQCYPCLDDRFAESGSASGHYFHQDLLVARRIFLNKPTLHVDIGSRVDGFVAHVAAFRSIEVFDIRELTSKTPNITFKRIDLMAKLDVHMHGYCDSLSCLHAIEHFGLGRYGDPIRFDGHIVGLENIYQLLQPGGRLYFSAPIGPQRIEFNAHRVFSLSYLLTLFKGRFKLDRCSFVNDVGDLYEDIALSQEQIENNLGCTFGCGIFELTKV